MKQPYNQLISMKLLNTLVLLLISFSLYAQISGTYQCENDESILVKITKSEIEIYQFLDNDTSIDTDCLNQISLFISPFSFRNDTMFCKQKPIFNQITEYILILNTNLSYKLKKGFKFYCITKRDTNGKIKFIGHWKNGKREGKWIIYNNVNKAKGYIYSNGKIVGTFVPDPAYNKI